MVTIAAGRTATRCARGVRLLVVAATATAFLAFAPDATAQCGAKRSTCAGCHDGARAAAPSGVAWHTDHAFADVCTACHGGAPESWVAGVAHGGMRDPLEDADATCGACHEAGRTDLVARYRTRLASVSDAGAPISDGATNAPPPAPKGGADTSSAATRGDPRANFMALAIVMVIGLAAAFWARRPLRIALSRRWSPYAAGVGLGLLITVSLGIFGHRLSGAGAYQHLSGYVARPLAPRSIYFAHVVPTGITWDVLVVVGAIVGSFVSAALGRELGLRTMPDTAWVAAFGDSVARRWGLAFVGCLLTEIGAGIAGGCTASLAMSGGAVFAPAAFAFMGGMFAGGIPTALFVHRRRQ